MASQIIHGGDSNESNNANRMQRDTWRPIRQSGGAPCLWALDQPACDPPSAYKWSDDTDQWGPGPFCADLRLGSLHTRSVPHYHQNMSNPHKHHPYFTIHTPLLLLAFSHSPPPSRHPQVPRVEYGAPKMKREHLLCLCWCSFKNRLLLISVQYVTC